MPRPTSKKDLLDAIEKERNALDKYLETLTSEQLVEPNIVGAWSVKDVLAHLFAWMQMCIGWYKTGLRNEIPALPAPGFKWNQTPQLNQHIYEKYKNISLDEVLTQFESSSREILEAIQGLSNDELFTARHFAWTKKNTLGTYMVSATSSHYFWARKEIRKGFRAKK
ncbi:MAG: ClbS/DfsB family four-helix bundle protein [Anaerolineae bacterium]|mgnify:CR=1 FL=1|jgi:hypothetical protein|nr:ClbS/DfsB family four-helix bundle protein [Anaerolineae bacterium]